MNKQGLKYKPRKHDFSNEPVKIRDLLLQFRFEKSITIGQAADMAEVNWVVWQYIEAGRTDIKLNMLLRLLRECGLDSVDDFLKGNFNKKFKSKADKVIEAYNATSPSKREIVDFILGLNPQKPVLIK